MVKKSVPNSFTYGIRLKRVAEIYIIFNKLLMIRNNGTCQYRTHGGKKPYLSPLCYT